MLGRIVVVDCVQRFRKSGQTVAKGTRRDLGKRGMFLRFVARGAGSLGQSLGDKGEVCCRLWPVGRSKGEVCCRLWPEVGRELVYFFGLFVSLLPVRARPTSAGTRPMLFVSVAGCGWYKPLAKSGLAPCC